MVAVGHPVGYYREPVQHDQPGDPYWTLTDFRPALRDLGIPATMIGGWYDMSLPSMLADYQALREGGQTVRLRVGPWHHSSQDLFRYSFQDAWTGSARTCSAGRTVLDLRPDRDDGRRRMARPATVATCGQHPAVAPAAARRAGHPGAARRRTHPVHLRPRRPHARGRRHQLEPHQRRTERQPGTGAAA